MKRIIRLTKCGNLERHFPDVVDMSVGTMTTMDHHGYYGSLLQSPIEHPGFANVIYNPIMINHTESI